MPLADLLDEDRLRRLISVRTDELAPSLGSVILDILESSQRVGSGSELEYYIPSVFFDLTELTESFAKVIRKVVEILSNKDASAIFLNMDMGSGKTHLLTLLLHLFASCNLSPERCRDYIGEYRRTGYSEKLAGNTVVIAIDMRSVGNVFKFLKLTEKILSKLQAYGAAEIIKKSVEKEELPDPKELAESIPKDINILILIDELHYAVNTSSNPAEREHIKEILWFIQRFKDYRRQFARESGIAIVVASARRDFENWQEVKHSLEDKDFVSKVESFENQLQRIEAVLERMEWMSLGDAKKILSKRLKLDVPFENVFHSSFNSLIIRILRADTDIPQAHHMRSLIQALAIYALNALKAGDKNVTPAHFDGRIVDVLMRGAEIAYSYKSIYDEIGNYLKNAEGEDLIRLAVNAIFTLTITGSPRKLIDMVRIAKTGEMATEHVSLVKEVELRNILRTHGVSDIDIDKIIKRLDDVHPNLHRVKLASGDYGYFVAPVVNVLAIYRKFIDERYKEYQSRPDVLENKIETFLKNLIYYDNNIEQVVIESFEELKKKPHQSDKLYIYIYLDRTLLFQLSESGETAENSLKELNRTARRFLEDRRNHNIVVVVPKITKKVLQGLSYYLAVDDATERIINHYIAPLEKPASGKEDEILRELTKIELQDLESEVGRKINDALARLTDAVCASLHTALYYTPDGVKEKILNISRTIERSSYPISINKAVGRLRESAYGGILNIARSLSDSIRDGYISFITDTATAVNIIYSDIESTLIAGNTAIISPKEPRLQRIDHSRWVYIPPGIVEKAATNIKNMVKERFEKDFEVEIVEENWYLQIRLKPKAKPLEPPKPMQPVSATRVAKPELVSKKERDLLDVIDEMKEKGGLLQITFKVDRDSADVLKLLLPRVRKYIMYWKQELDDRSS